MFDVGAKSETDVPVGAFSFLFAFFLLNSRAPPPRLLDLNVRVRTRTLNRQTLKFGIGDGHLQYYLFNWRCKEITPEEVGLVLL